MVRKLVLVRMAAVATLAAASISGGASAQQWRSDPRNLSGSATALPSDGSVVVTARRPDKACGERDLGCFRAVGVQLWQRYPGQIASFCQSTRTQKARQQLVLQQFLEMTGGDPKDANFADGNNDLPQGLAIVCDAKPGVGGPKPTAVDSWAPWAAAPSDADLAAVYPRKALGEANGGEALIYCSIYPNGHLIHCSVSSETPDGKGFGAAALGLTRKFKVQLTPAQASKLEHAHVDLAVRFANPNNPSGPRVLVQPDWIGLPDPAKTDALYPAAATAAGVTTGVGLVDCQVGQDGLLGGCALKSEEPVGLGFGAAALQAAPAMRANLWTRDGYSAPGAHVVVPIRFNDPGARAAG